MFFTEQDKFTYVPLSSFIILLVILLTCASRKRKQDPFSAAAEHSLESDIQGDYAIMCFPCLKRKPELNGYEPTADLSDQFEYIVEKYTIRKVPLLLANTAEDLIERQEELEMAETRLSQPELVRDDFVNFQVAQEVFNVQRVPPCITVAANTGCPGRKIARDRSRPADVLESMSPISRPNLKNTNYVVIPTKGSLRNKDIMMTKREITNQYLNNFSSVFVDNLKDQVPKDPEQFPNLSRPYTSAFKNLPFAETFLKTKAAGGKRSKRSKSQKVAYAFPAENDYVKEEGSIKEEEEPYYDSDSGSKDQTTDAPESEFQEDNENYGGDATDKSLVLLNESDNAKEAPEGAANPFKTTIKSSASEFDCNNTSHSADYEYQGSSFALSPSRDDWQTAKVTYEDIQALDVGYEFTSCEKLGVKPKMTRIHYPHEGERSKDPKTVGDSKSSKKNFFAADPPQLQQMSSSMLGRASAKPKQHPRVTADSAFGHGGGTNGNALVPPKEKLSSKSLLAETSFLPKIESSSTLAKPSVTTPGIQERPSTTTFTSKSEGSKAHSVNELDANDCPADSVLDTVAEISTLYDLAMPLSRSAASPSPYHQQQQEQQKLASPQQQEETSFIKIPTPSKSRSFQETIRPGSRKENALEAAKGNDITTEFPRPKLARNKSLSRLDEQETETTSCSLQSPDSKTSSAVTSPRSSEKDEGKRATLRWKIVIKHHRDEDSSRKSPNKNIKL